MSNFDDEKGWRSLEEAEAKLGSENEVFLKLREAETEACLTNKRYSHKEVISDLREQLSKKASSD